MRHTLQLLCLRSVLAVGLVCAGWLLLPSARAEACPAAMQDLVNDACRVNIVAGAGSGGTASTFGAASPATGTAAGARDTGGNMQPLQLDGAGVGRNLNVNISANSFGTFTDNITQFGGVNLSTGTGASGVGIPRVTVANDSNVLATQSGTWTLQPGNTPNTSAWIMQVVPGATNGANTCNLQSAATTNATNCKNAAGTLYGYELINTTATLYYLRLYNLTTAPTCSSATGFIRSIPIPASATGNGVVRDLSVGEAYATGLAFCLTGGGSATDNTNAAVGVYLSLLYK